MMPKCTVIIPTHSDYIDICQILLKLISKNWEDNSYRIVVSVTGEDTTINGYDCIFNNGASLLTCVYNAAVRFPSQCYLVLLGDAFITQPINNLAVNRIIDAFILNSFSYCNLRPYKSINKKKSFDDSFNYINKKDWYSHSFIAFLASRSFIFNEFNNDKIKSDRDFELKYLKITNLVEGNSFYNDHVVLIDNIFHISPGIEKGKWDILLYNKLSRDMPEIKDLNREKVSLFWQIVLVIRRKVVRFIPNGFRKRIKNYLNNWGLRFDNSL